MMLYNPIEATSEFTFSTYCFFASSVDKSFLLFHESHFALFFKSSNPGRAKLYKSKLPNYTNKVVENNWNSRVFTLPTVACLYNAYNSRRSSFAGVVFNFLTASAACSNCCNKNYPNKNWIIVGINGDFINFLVNLTSAENMLTNRVDNGLKCTFVCARYRTN